MRITFDRAKRARMLTERGLDFADAVRVFAGLHATLEDMRRDYGEQRFISAGMLDGRWWSWSGRRAGMRAASFR